MITGHLRYLLMNSLAENPLSGYGLMKKIKSDTCGCYKPSTGSVYPILKDLLKEKDVECKTMGRKRVYSLTKKGKEELSHKPIDHDLLVKKMVEATRVFEKLSGLSNTHDMMNEFIEALKEDKEYINKFKPIGEDMAKLKMTILRLVKENKVETNKAKIKSILNKTTKKLESIR